MPTTQSNQEHEHNVLQPGSIQITGVAILDLPAGGPEYRGVVRSQHDDGHLLTQTVLPARAKSAWLVNVCHPGLGRLEIVVQFRPTAAQQTAARPCPAMPVEDEAPWQDMGRAILNPRTYLDWTGSTVVDLPLHNWDEQTTGRIQVRLLKESHTVTERPVFLPPAPNGAVASGCPMGFGRPAPVVRNSPPVITEAVPDDTLTAPEAVIVSDSWNKLLAYQDMLVEMFFERLLHEAPDLIETFGEAIDLVPRYLAEFFDVSVRALNPHTAQVLRESYRGIYPAPPDGYKTAGVYAELLADLGMNAGHWLTARRVWVWMMTQVPHLEDYDRENLARGVHSAAYRFFTLHILSAATAAIDRYAGMLTPAAVLEMRRCADVIATDPLVVGLDFHRILFRDSPGLMPYFGHTDADSLTGHLVKTVNFLVQSLEEGREAALALRNLSRQHTHLGVPPHAYEALAGPLLTVMKRYIPDFTPDLARAWQRVLTRVGHVLQQPALARQRLLQQAGEFIDQLAVELHWSADDHARRWRDIELAVSLTGTYVQTPDELAYGAQLAWRNASKCIGRIAWRTMIVRDLRHITDPDAMFRESVEHLRMGTNGGNMQVVINVFRPKKPGERWGPRIWNAQYVRFAAYGQADGTVLGDKANLALTAAIRRLGWTPPATKTAFDTLPLVIEVPGQAPKLYEFSDDDVLKVPIVHPLYPQIDALNLQWCAIPAISNFKMEIGGIQYGCVPFNGWFMETEIARNLWEDGRYGQAEAIAQAMGLDTSSELTLWRDRAFLELNAAILHSFSTAKVTLVDHQTAARQFMSHDLREKRAGRECPAQWSWVAPSAGGSTTPVWHHEMRDFYLSPSYQYAADKWATIDAELTIAGENSTADRVAEHRVVILYGSETGTAERYAYQTARRLDHHHPRVMALDEYDPARLDHEELVLVITSTFADGELPGNAKKFHAWIREQPTRLSGGPDYSVMALGSTIYPEFCAAGHTLSRELNRIGGHRVVPLHQGDEIKNQAKTVHLWLDEVARWLGDDPAATDSLTTDTAPLQVSFLTPAQVAAVDPVAQQRHRPGVDVPVVANRELLKEVILGSRSTRFMAFDISGTDLHYETGDHLAVYPHNPAGLVHRLRDRLRLAPGAWFVATLVDGHGKTVGNGPVSAGPMRVEQVLTEDVDLTLREPFDELIGLLHQLADAPAEQAKLAAWVELLDREARDDARQELTKSLMDQFLTIADLLDAFPSAPVTLAQLLGVLPRHKPRLYSISSCSLVHPGQIHITVGVVQATTDAGQTRAGLCSNYLAGLTPEHGDRVRLAVRTSTFRPPLDPQAPMLMVGPGTGLSPLLGFLQHREVQLNALHEAALLNSRAGHDAAGAALLPVRTGDAWLYFGCRNLNDYLYRQELETWHEAGVLTHLEVAFSRMGEEIVYVQHLIGRHSTDMWEVLAQPNCHFYVCGDVQMADDVFDVLMEIAQTVGMLSYADAIRFFWQMQQEKRLVMDVWGSLLKPRQSRADLQTAGYTTQGV